MRSLLAIVALIAISAGMFAANARLAHAQSCHQLWVERNSYFKRAGYCFKTSRAIEYFGNGGCRYHSESALPLSGSERRRIAEITRLERIYGC